MAKGTRGSREPVDVLQAEGLTVTAANGGSTASRQIVPDLPDPPAAPVNDTMEPIGNGSPHGPAAATASEINIPQADASSGTPLEPAPQPADGSAPLNGSASPAAQAVPGADLQKINVADIRKNSLDSRGERIDFVFFRYDCFAVYWCNGRIMVQYADKDVESKRQVANLAELFPLRDRLQYLVSDMQEIQSGSSRETPHAYEWQIAESLRLGLVGQKDAAKRMMQAAIDNVVAKRVSDGRTGYLIWAGSLVLGAIALLGAVAIVMPYLLGYTPEQLRPGLGYLMLATASGAMGAMLSTAIALRDRTVGTDGWKSNGVDSATRIMIGVISAALLYTLLESNLLSTFSVSIDQLTKSQPAQIWNVALVVGFLAGFLERLVPNLLEKKVAPAIVK